MLPLQRKDIRHPFGRKVKGFHAAAIEQRPFLGREVEQFGFPDRKGDDETIGQVTQDMEQSPLAQVNQTRCIIDNDMGH